jgi:hypothetical protein
MVLSAGFEPTLNALEERCFIQLSYESVTINIKAAA